MSLSTGGGKHRTSAQRHQVKYTFSESLCTQSVASCAICIITCINIHLRHRTNGGVFTSDAVILSENLRKQISEHLQDPSGSI